MESDYLIKNPSHALVIEAIKTLPGEPESIKLELLADGLKMPLFPDNDEEIKEYIKTCKYQNIIPFSNKRVRYNFQVEESIHKNPEVIKTFFAGGRTNMVNIDIYSSFDWKTIETFKEVLFPSLLENNYKVSYGEIVVSGHKTGSHESEGYNSDLALRINYGDKKGLSLLLDENYKNVQTEKSIYEKWFKDLKTKYKVRE
jgi:hypothetical protein